MKQKWTRAVLSSLNVYGPLTTRELNLLPRLRRMNKQHWDRRANTVGVLSSRPINSMVYDTLKRLQKRGIVVKDEATGKWSVV